MPLAVWQSRNRFNRSHCRNSHRLSSKPSSSPPLGKLLLSSTYYLIGFRDSGAEDSRCPYPPFRLPRLPRKSPTLSLQRLRAKMVLRLYPAAVYPELMLFNSLGHWHFRRGNRIRNGPRHREIRESSHHNWVQPREVRLLFQAVDII